MALGILRATCWRQLVSKEFAFGFCCCRRWEAQRIWIFHSWHHFQLWDGALAIHLINLDSSGQSFARWRMIQWDRSCQSDSNIRLCCSEQIEDRKFAGHRIPCFQQRRSWEHLRCWDRPNGWRGGMPSTEETAGANKRAKQLAKDQSGEPPRD